GPSAASTTRCWPARAGRGAARATERATCSPGLASLSPVDIVPGQEPRPSAEPDGPLVVIGGYVLLLLLGALQGLIGCFQYSRALGSFPVAAVVFAILIGVTCVL